MTDPPTAALGPLRSELAELLPVARRAADLDPRALMRLRADASTITSYVRLPFQVLVSRSIAAVSGHQLDITLNCADLVAWLDGERTGEPPAHDEQWRSGLPPTSGWVRIDRVPDDVVRGLVRQGALALKEAAQREGVPGAQPRAEVADALLDSVVLTVSDDAGTSADVTLRALSALTRMGFLPRGSHIAVAVAGRWTRVAAEYGSVYLERPGLGLGLLG